MSVILAHGHSPDWLSVLFLLVYSFEFWVGLLLVLAGLVTGVGRWLWQTLVKRPLRWLRGMWARQRWGKWGQSVDRVAEREARRVVGVFRGVPGCALACLVWGWLIGWTAAVLYAGLLGLGWMLAMCLTVATGSWCMAAWWRWYSRGGGQ